MTKKEIGEVIAKIRKKNNVSTYKMQQNGVNLQRLQSIEKADKNYTIDSLLLVASLAGAEVIIKEKVSVKTVNKI